MTRATAAKIANSVGALAGLAAAMMALPYLDGWFMQGAIPDGTPYREVLRASFASIAWFVASLFAVFVVVYAAALLVVRKALGAFTTEIGRRRGR